MRTKGYIMLNKRPYTADKFDPVLAEEAAKINYFNKYYMSVVDDALVLKKDQDEEKVDQRIYFANIDNIGVVTSEKIYYFVGSVPHSRPTLKSCYFSRQTPKRL